MQNCGKLRILTKNKILSNAFWLTLGKTGQVLLNFLVGTLTVRYLGPSNYGLVSYAAAYSGFFYSLCTLGLPSVLVKEFQDHPGEEGEILGTSLALRAGSSILSAGLILGVVLVVDRGDLITAAVVALCIVGMVLRIFETFSCWFQSRQESKITAVANLAASVITAAYKALLLILGKSVAWFAMATAVDYLCLAVAFYSAYRRCGGGKLQFSRERGQSLLKKSGHFILPGLMVAVYAQTDKFMLKQLLGQAETGYYATAVSLSTAWCFVLSAIIDAVTPEITEAYGRNKDEFRRRNRQLYAVIFYLSAVVSILLTCFAEPLVAWIYGEAYRKAAGPLRVVTWYTAFSYLGVARNAWVVCENRQKYLIWVYFAAAISNIGLNLLLIPRWGSVGAAVASLVAQVVTAVIFPLFIPQMRENVRLMWDGILLRNLRENV